MTRSAARARLFFEAFAGSKTTRIFIPVAFANLSIVDRLGFAAPLSSRAIVDCEVPIFFASSACDSFARVRASISKLATAKSCDSIAALHADFPQLAFNLAPRHIG